MSQIIWTISWTFWKQGLNQMDCRWRAIFRAKNQALSNLTSNCSKKTAQRKAAICWRENRTSTNRRAYKEIIWTIGWSNKMKSTWRRRDTIWCMMMSRYDLVMVGNWREYRCCLRLAKKGCLAYSFGLVWAALRFSSWSACSFFKVLPGWAPPRDSRRDIIFWQMTGS